MKSRFFPSVFQEAQTSRLLVQDFLKETFEDAYLAGLFFPSEKRRSFYALAGFHSELRHIQALPHESTSQIRFQWWRDVLSGERGKEARSVPLACEILTLFSERRLVPGPLLGAVEAFEALLLSDAPDIQAYFEHTSEALMRLNVSLLTGEDPVIKTFSPAWNDVFFHVGRVIGITRLLRLFPWILTHGDSFLARIAVRLVPATPLREPYEWVQAARAQAFEHLDHMARLSGVASSKTAPAFLEAYLSKSYLTKIRGDRWFLETGAPEVSRLRKLFVLWSVSSPVLRRLFH